MKALISIGLSFVLCFLIGCSTKCQKKGFEDLDWMFSEGREYSLLFDGVVYEYTNDKWGGNTREHDILREKGRAGGFFNAQDEEMLKNGKAYFLPKNTKIQVILVEKYTTITQSVFEVRFKILTGANKGKIVVLDEGWNQCRGDYLLDKIGDDSRFKGVTFHYPDPKYFKRETQN